MKKILSTSESIDPQQEGNLLREIHATGDASYDERSERLCMKLDCFQRESCWGKKDREQRVDWLPQTETLHEPMSIDEALPAARSIFHGWTERIRQSLADHQEAVSNQTANVRQ